MGEIARLAYETVRERMAVAVDQPDARPGRIGVIQPFSSSLKWNPHIHAIASRGVWTPDGEWIPVPYVDEHRAELLFRHSGFSVQNRTTVYPNDTKGRGRVLHDEDLAQAIVDRVLERGRLLTLDGPSMPTKHLRLDEP